MRHLILAINPGSISTKIGLYRDEDPVFTRTIEHDHAEILKFPSIPSQKEMRMALVLETLKQEGYGPEQLSGVVGRGGLLPPMETGGYLVNQAMLDMIINEAPGVSPHASNLGALLADGVAKLAGLPAYIYDAVSAGRLPEIATVTGFPEITRRSFSHVLNCRAQGIQYAKGIGKRFEDVNLIIAHLGGGVSLGVYEKGQLVDSVADDYHSFSPERSGGVPLLDFTDFCFDRGLTKKDVIRRIRGNAGLKAHLGTADCREAEKRMENGDDKARLVLTAMCYNIAKSICSLLPALAGKCDAVILTGGIAKSAFVTAEITKRVNSIAPVAVLPGEYELEALAAGCLRIITGLEEAHEIAALGRE
ncbi:MAG: butyrate kinase [Clostridiales bacterium]|jgi:butyrate kinase|nr:butyrate kinase [Clostridiales bacterium]